MKTSFRGLAALIVLAAAAMPLAAQQGNPVQTRLEARKVVQSADGRETFEPADSARPGDVIEYVATYRNTGRQPVRNLEATLPIPDNTEFVAGSARPANARASTNAKSFAEIPLKRRVVKAGREVEEVVPLRDYRQLRWYPGELGPEKSATFTARVRVLDDSPPNAKAAR